MSIALRQFMQDALLAARDFDEVATSPLPLQPDPPAAAAADAANDATTESAP